MSNSFRHYSLARIAWVLTLLTVLVAPPVTIAPARADHTPEPSIATIVGSTQDELGCPSDWQPDCASTYLNYNADDDVWQATFAVPAGNWEYKVALNDSWDENYGANAQQNGPNIPLDLTDPTDVKFYYDHKSHWVTDNGNAIIATVPGSFQSELGCPGDWQPDCLRSWLQDANSDGLYSFSTVDIPAGDYEAKVAHNESWDENYGTGGVQDGPNIPFTVGANEMVTFEYDPVSHLLTITTAPTTPPGPTSVTIAGSLQSELGCPGDWQPDCANTYLTYDSGDDIWQGVLNLLAGDWEYKAALNDSWDENYGANAQLNGPNIGLPLAAPTDVKFYYDHKSHWVTDNRNAIIATASGSFQSELGCLGDWQPDCLRSWLEDPDGNGIYSFATTDLPAGDYEVKVAINESWDENYGAGGVADGPNISFTVPTDGVEMIFEFDYSTKILAISGAAPPQPGPVADAGPDVLNHPPLIDVTFDGTGSYHRDPSRSIVAYTWDSGDGSPPVAGPIVAHAFPAVYNPDGTIDWTATTRDFTVTLTVTDDSDPALTDSDTAVVHITPPPWPPVADADGPYTVYMCETVTLDGSASYDPNGQFYPDPSHPWHGEIVSWEWDLDNDGEYDDATGETVSWSSCSPGIFVVGLRVTNSFGSTDEVDTVVNVAVPQPELWAVEYRWGDPPPGFRWDPFPLVFEGWMDVRVENRGDGDAFNVTAAIVSWPANTTVPDPDVTVGNIPAGGSAWSADTFTTRVDITIPVDPCEEVFWRVEYDDVAGVHHVVENVPEFPPGEGPSPCP